MSLSLSLWVFRLLAGGRALEGFVLGASSEVADWGHRAAEPQTEHDGTQRGRSFYLSQERTTSKVVSGCESRHKSRAFVF